MKKAMMVVLLLAGSLAWAGGDIDPAQYTINVHVTASRVDIQYGEKIADVHQRLQVVIDGKKYELQSALGQRKLLALGDYKAKLVKDESSPGKYDSYQTYELLLPDNKVRRFEVIGMME